MKRKPSPPKDFSYQGANFVLRYSWPSARRHTATPCRGYVDPLDPMTGKPLSKRQVYGKDSDEPVHYTVYGKDPQDIWDHHREEAASHLTALMVQRGLLGAEPAPDPATTAEIAILARNFAGTFFFLHRSEWGVTTMEEYRRQFDILMDELGDLRVGDLNDEVYRRLQETICRNALAGARKMESWTYGEEPPSSARKRMSILYELIQDLKQVEGVPIPTVPKRYNSKPSRQQQLLDIVDSARSLPVELLQNTLSSPSLLSQVKILADTGLRISEMIGLHFGSVQAISTSQGIMYYLTVTGQIDSSGKRTEITKTGASYRVVPLSSELGEFLMEQRQKMELQYGDLSLHLLCGCAKTNGFSDDPRTVTAINNEVSNLVPALLRRPDFFKALTTKRAYLFDEQIQDKELSSMLTCHALRRNFCTWLYCSSGLDSTKIYQQMGHTYKPQPRRTAAGLTLEEVRCMCLRKHVSSTLYHPANPLRYPVKGSFHASKIPACSVELELNPGETIELTVEDTEPGTVTHVGGKSISVRSLHRDRQHNVIYRYSLLAADEITSGLKKCKLLA